MSTAVGSAATGRSGRASSSTATPPTVLVRVYVAGVLVGEEEVKGPLAVHKPAPAVKKQPRGGK